ncbi:alpha/beta-hydrolase [Wolfiporia cocos MD-104 SS10]|uniref:Alpha/beta-hydrolase n=1 Tax=Wolfiporia cocos (strain MD-104) TaxID=742152 RepID=A0A2H3JXP0_WOLCO|nr:alpha/beta-hydrolase [Wolfiporia cocos MD-104 SS10]
MPVKELYTTSTDGTKIWAESTGNPSKPAVVFIHGLSCTAFAYDKQFVDPDLLKNLYMVRYELRGHGRSGMPEDIEAYASPRQAEDFAAVCEAFGLKKPFVCAWSLGACIPCDIVGNLGAEYISGVIYSAGSPVPSPTIAERCVVGETFPSAFHPMMVDILSLDSSTAARSAATFVDSCVAHPSRDLPWPVKLLWMGGYGSQLPQIRNYHISRAQDNTRWLAEAAKQWPVLMIHGLKDLHRLTDVVTRQLKEVYVNTEVQYMEDVGHAPHYERPGETNRLLLGFVQKHSA